MTSFLGILEARAFASMWYWLFLALCWAMATRSIIGVPPQIALRAKRACRKHGDADSDALALLDWLTMTLPLWRISRADSIILSALAGLLLSFMAAAGFRLGYQSAQAATLLLAPLSLLWLMKIRLAARLDRLLERAMGGEIDVKEASGTAARIMIQHRWRAFFLALLSIFGTTLWGSLWILMHPFGV